MGALESAIQANSDALVRLSEPDLDELLSVMAEAQRDIRKVLASLEKPDGYTAHRLRSTYVQLDKAIREAHAQAGGAMADELHDGVKTVGATAIKGLARMVRAGEKDFPGSTLPLRIDVAAVLAKSERTLLGRYSRLANTYSADLEHDIRRSLMSGILRGESIDQMASRVLRGTGLIRRLQGDPGAQLDAIVDRPFSRMRSRAEMIARTEVVGAYNTVALEGMADLNIEDPGYMKRWDAAADGLVCPMCAEMDNVTIEMDQSFAGDVDAPPLHPRCRCAVVAWRSEWNGDRKQQPKPAIDVDADA